MPENKDNTFEYISALQDFNKSVGYLIKAIQANTAKNTDTKSTIANNAEYFKEMAIMAEQLEVVVENTTKTKENTDKILLAVEAIKKEKKKGIFDRLSPKDKTAGVLDGIKTITLMAGGILAIGAAFKLIGEVDFESVIALSVALPLIGYAFSEMDKTLTPKEAAVISLNMIIMSAGLVGSGFLLQYMPDIGFKQIVSIIGVTVGMGIAMVGMGYVADMLNAKEVKSLYAIAGAMPAMALGVMLSAFFLSEVPEVPFMKTVESTAAVSVSIGIAGLVIAGLNILGVKPMTALQGSISMIAIAGGLAISSQILSMGDYSNYPNLDWAQGVGLSMIASIPPVLAFGLLAATGIGALVIGAGILSMIAVAGGLVASSHILAEGNYSKYPSLEWSTGVGMGISAFTNALSQIEPGPMDLLFGDSIDSRIQAIVKLGGALKEVSHEIKGGSYTGGPSKEWSAGIGMSLYYFTAALENISPNFFERFVFGDTTAGQIELMVQMAGALPRIGLAIGKDTSMYKGGPDEKWAKGVGQSIKAFAEALDSVEPNFFERFVFGDTTQGQIDLMIQMAAALPRIGMAVGSDTSMYKGGPDEKWAKGVGGSVLAFSQAIAAINDEVDLEDVSTAIAVMMPMAPLIKYFGMTLSGVDFSNAPSEKWSKGIGAFLTTFSELDINDDPVETSSGIIELSKAYIKLATSLSVLGNAAKGLTELPDMTSLYGGLVTLSLVDEDALEGALDIINGKQSEFANLFSMIKASNEVKIDESTFAFNKDKKDTKSNKSTQPTNVKGSNTSSVQVTPTVTTKTVAKETTSNQEKLLKDILQQLTQLNGGIIEIADNTSKTLSDNSNLISN